MPGGTQLLEGRVAVITGAGQGIGRGIARRMTREGAKVVVTDINLGDGNEGTDELSGIEIPLDRINTVFFNQSFFERIIGAGDLDASILGSGSIVAQAATAGLLDELQVMLVPVTLGGGKRLFDGGHADHRVSLACSPVDMVVAG